MAQALQNLLTDYGYNLVALPKADLQPLGLLFKRPDGLGSVDSTLLKLFTIADAAPPMIRRDGVVPDLKGSALVTFDAKAGVNLLQSLLGHLGLGKASAKLDLNTNHTVTVGYENITEDKTDLLELDSYISGSDPDKVQFNTFKDKLENSELYVINAVLKSSTFSIKVEDKSGQRVNLDAAVKGMLDAKVDVSHRDKNFMTIKHKGAPLVFAFKAQRIMYDRKKWWSSQEARFRIIDQQGVVLKDESELPTDPLVLGLELADL
jgi:hypothetical protein